VTPTQFISRIISNDRISEGFYELTLTWDKCAPIPLPGQFLTIRINGGCSNSTVPLLRRPFAFAGFDVLKSVAKIIYQKRGAGTEILAAAKVHEGIDVIGPLGTPFVVDTDKDTGINTDNHHIINNNSITGINSKKRVIVAGGVGLGPMLFLSSFLTARSIPSRFIFGCRNQSFIPSTKTFTDANPQICTDDGSVGFHGTVADYINTNILSDINDDTKIYACGPSPMLKSVNRIAQSRNADCLVSLEAMMACGVGACMGCVVPVVNGGYSRVCKEGPVFNGKDILWERM